MDTPKPSVSAPTIEAVRKRAGVKFFKRGEEVLAKGLVKGFAVTADGSKASARVAGHGAEDYRVEVGLAPNGSFAHFCTCPVGVQGAFCKHTVAVALAWCGDAGGMASFGEKGPPEQEPKQRPTDFALPQVAEGVRLPMQASSLSPVASPSSLAASPGAPLMPARRLSNYLYCPRLFYLQWVENLFEENEDTAAGDAVHRKADSPTRFNEEKMSALREGLPDGAVIRSLRLENEALGLCGVVDIVEGGPDGSELVDYKRGSPHRFADGTPAVKENDMFQLAAYAMMMLADGAKLAPRAAVYYAAERMRVSFPLGEALFARVRAALAEARAVAASERMPLPLRDDARCSFCSAYPLCLPRETLWWHTLREPVPPQDDRPVLPGFEEYFKRDQVAEVAAPDLTGTPPRPPRLNGEILVVQTAGAQIGQSGGEFTVSVKGDTVRKLPLHQTKAIYLYGAVQMTAQAVQSALEEDVDVAYFSPSGRFLGLLRGLPASGIDARLGQYDRFRNPSQCLRLARTAICAKIHNQRVMLMRNGSPPQVALNELARLRDSLPRVESIEEVMGVEGAAASIYFAHFGGMLKGNDVWAFDTNGRNRRPPRDPVNALLSLAYSMLAKELAGVCHAVGLDPFLGFLHQPRYGRPALALDLMEEFRPLVADSVAVSLVNRGEVDESDFIRSASGTVLNDHGRRAFWEAWFRRLDAEVTHPEFGYRMSYRRMFEVQARQLWRFVRGEAIVYHSFTTR